jgi:DNA-binding MarR family transcriptional regulator
MYDPNGLQVDITCHAENYPAIAQHKQSITRLELDAFVAKTRAKKLDVFGQKALDARDPGLHAFFQTVRASQRMSQQASAPESLIKNLAYTLYWVDESLQLTLQNAGWERMSRTKSMIMLNIIYGVTRPIQLAGNLGISRQAVHQILQEMSREGLVELIEDPNDRRAKIVVIRKTAANISRDIQRAMTAIEDEVARRIGCRALQQLLSALQKDWGALYAATIVPAKGAPTKTRGKAKKSGLVKIDPLAKPETVLRGRTSRKK